MNFKKKNQNKEAEIEKYIEELQKTEFYKKNCDMVKMKLRKYINTVLEFYINPIRTNGQHYKGFGLYFKKQADDKYEEDLKEYFFVDISILTKGKLPLEEIIEHFDGIYFIQMVIKKFNKEFEVYFCKIIGEFVSRMICSALIEEFRENMESYVIKKKFDEKNTVLFFAEDFKGMFRALKEKIDKNYIPKEEKDCVSGEIEKTIPFIAYILDKDQANMNHFAESFNQSMSLGIFKLIEAK